MRRSAFLVVPTLAVLLAASHARAQFGSLRGNVVDDDGVPVEDATVVVRTVAGQALKLESTTDKTGSFSQVTVQTSGPWDVAVVKAGYDTWQIPQPIRVPLGGGTVTLPPITLTRTAPSAQEILSGKFKAATDLLVAADAAQRRGDAGAATEKLDAAEAAFRGFLESDPSNSRAHFNLALVYDRRQQWSKAAAAYLAAADLEPSLTDASVGAGAALINAREPGRAVEVLDRALAREPGNPRLESLLGLAHYNLANYGEAAAHYEKVREAVPGDPESHYYLGMIAVAENRTADAKALLERYVEVASPGDPNVKTAEALLDAIRKRE